MLASRRAAVALSSAALAVFLICGLRVTAQAADGTIRATVTDPQGGTFPVAFVSAKREPSGPSFDGKGGADGVFTFDVPAGTYELSANVPGMKSFRRGGLTVAAGQTLRIDVHLEDTVSLRTLGEDPTAIVATYFNRPEPPRGPTPRLTNGKPDLTGVWLGGPTDLGDLDLQPWAAALLREREDNHLKDWPPSYCQPAAAVPFFTGGFFKLVHHPSTLVFIVENATGFTQMLLDGRPHPPGAGPNWLGHQVGTWDGDTLVVDAIGFRDRGWLNFSGHPHSDKLHVVERLRRPDLGHLEIEVTLDDPGAFQKKWTGTLSATLAPDVELQEFICNENNRDAAHLVGK
ncbi:MAG TPA: carboxypeptidase-like regulatory domain-containing protein [Vicinamibacterales bacterium]|nr:carboxypeptidase-like regulatory domain-containing protein [Vicinamibacterales bacterium]